MLKKAWFVLIAATLFITACEKPQIPHYVDFTNFNVSQMGWTQSVVSADLKYYNPNKYDLKLSNADLDIFVGNKFVGKTLLDTMINIPKLDTFFVPVKITVDSKNLVNNALSVLLSNEISIKVQGTARLGRSGLFMSVPVFYEGKQKLSF